MRYVKILLQALLNNRLDVFSHILKTKVSSEDFGWLGEKLLMKATHFNRKDFINLLVSKGCSLSLPDQLIQLMETCNLGDIVCVSEKNRNGDTPLHLVFTEEERDGLLLDELLVQSCRGESKNVKNNEGISFLHIACARYNLDVAEYYIATAGTDINCQVSEYNLEYGGYTPLHFAVENGHLELAALLLENGADIHIKDTSHSTPIHLACENHNIDMIDLLFRYETEFEDCVDCYGLTHLMAASMGSQPNVVQSFLFTEEHHENYFNINSELVNTQVNVSAYCPFAGYTPLHFAAEFGRTETARILIGAGANIFVQNAYSVRPLRLACMKRCIRTADAIGEKFTGISKQKKRRSPDDEDLWISKRYKMCLQARKRRKI